MARRASAARFTLANLLAWLLMTVILVLVPDTLERWVSLPIARLIGWALGSGIWVMMMERSWCARVGPVARFLVQLALWLSSALVAMVISDAARP
ncbi:MAG: hypothetical protein ABIW19_03210 [Vicinamibacterales bacterium]